MDKRILQGKITRERHKLQTCKVFECKVDFSKLSQKTINHLQILFKEAKWFYNYVVAGRDVNEASTTIKSVPVLVVDKFESRDLTVLKAQMKQAIKNRAFNSVKSLSTKKKNGLQVGRLKFKSIVNSIPLSKNGTTLKSCAYSTNFINNTIKISGIKQSLKVRGLDQIPAGAELANAVLVRKPSGFYINITTYQDKITQIAPPEASVGIDFGCQTQLTLSNGIKIEFQVPISNKIKRIDRKIMKNKRKQSINKFKDEERRRKEYEKLNNKKKDIHNKIVNAITTNFKYISFQDENIHEWASSGHGKKIQHSGIGGIISDLKHKSHTPLLVDKFFPSTQLCPICGKKNKLLQSERVYLCECGFKMDRDVKSAICIEKEGLKKIPTEHRKFKLRESLPSTFFDTLSKINGIKVSKTDLLSEEVAKH